MTPAHLCYLGLGGNLGHPMALFDQVLAELAATPGASTLRESPRYRSAPVEATGPDYINSVVELHWTGTPEALLEACLQLESVHGRVRTVRNAPRLIDVDVLLVGDLTAQSDFLTLPHPRMHQRRFVLQPLLDLNANVHIPGLGPAAQFLAATQDQRIQIV